MPNFIADIILANSDLSDTGFGPISKNSSNLYAGRWLDQSTGNIRVLPPADDKFINPTSWEQKVGYLEAKVINHWNNTVHSND